MIQSKGENPPTPTTILDDHLAMAETRLNEVRERESSFWHFMSAENLLGLSAFITHDGTPFTHVELKDLERYCERLQTIRRGFLIFADDVRHGPPSRTTNPFVKEFLASPYASLIHLMSPVADDEGQKNVAKNTLVNLINGAAHMAESYGLEQFASALVDNVEPLIHDPHLRDGLPGWFERKVSWTLYDMGNAVASADGILFMAAGGIAGRVIGATLLGQWLGINISTSSALTSAERAGRVFAHMAKPKVSGLILGALPGSPLYRLAPNATNLMKLGAGILNFGWEGVKFAAGAAAAEDLLGKDARWWFERLFLFSSAGHSAFSPAWRSGLAWRIASGGEKGLFLDFVARYEVQYPTLSAILRDIETQTGTKGMMLELRKRFFRTEFERVSVATGKDPFNPIDAGIVYLERFTREYPTAVILALLGKYDRALMKTKTIEEAWRIFNDKLARITDADRAWQFVRDALKRTSKAVKNEMNRVRVKEISAQNEALGRAAEERALAFRKETVRAAVTKTESAVRPPEAAPPKSTPPKRRHLRKEGQQDVQPKIAEMQDPNAHIAKVFDQKILKPTTTIDATLVADMSGGRIRVINSAQDDLARFYSKCSHGQRASLWQDLKRLTMGENLGKKTFRGEKIYPEGVVHHYHPTKKMRIFYSICDDGIRIVKVEKSSAARSGNRRWREL